MYVCMYVYISDCIVFLFSEIHVKTMQVNDEVSVIILLLNLNMVLLFFRLFVSYSKLHQNFTFFT